MSKILGGVGITCNKLILCSPLTLFLSFSSNSLSISCSIKPLKFYPTQRFSCTFCGARRRVRYDDEYEEEKEEEEYEYNEKIAMLEFYSQSAKEEALLVKAMVDEEEVEILIFKGFSSSLSYRTSADPSRSIIPAKGVIKSIDIIRGPFDPSNIEYIEKELSWETFNTRIQSKINN